MARNNLELWDADYLVLSTGWEKYWGMKEYFSDFPVLSEDAVDYILKLGLKGIGTDTMSVDRMNSTDFPVHHKLMANHLVIIENLCNLTPVRGKTVLFAALPLKFRLSDGAPVRAIAVTP
ncbi:MAG: cyclase family protein [Clostridiaceae bacterium]|nr:cyclase family protein [Clostridiaceae bacterium]